MIQPVVKASFGKTLILGAFLSQHISPVVISPFIFTFSSETLHQMQLIRSLQKNNKKKNFIDINPKVSGERETQYKQLRSPSKPFQSDP